MHVTARVNYSLARGALPRICIQYIWCSVRDGWLRTTCRSDFSTNSDRNLRARPMSGFHDIVDPIGLTSFVSPYLACFEDELFKAPRDELKS
mmetsp:Transcript_8372/g.26182  ORF Transcript_8372/g.26182 Transcript_8372/m.26182 type:complete len:92 (+) Transcript_8372:1740-2015(+)